MIKTAIPHKAPNPDPRRSEARNGPEVVTTIGDCVPWSFTLTVAVYVSRLCNPLPNFVYAETTQRHVASLGQADRQNMVAGPNSFEIPHVN